MSVRREIFVSVDVETAGPIPCEYSMLTLGACAVDAPERTFACTLQPINSNADPEALKVTGLSLDELATSGQPPVDAMAAFDRWLTGLATDDARLVLVGLNAPFDWSFVNYYFHRFLGRNPFGFTALDIKAMYMGATGSSWADTRSSSMAERLRPRLRGDHDALNDALYQAELFRLIRSEYMQQTNA